MWGPDTATVVDVPTNSRVCGCDSMTLLDGDGGGSNVGVVKQEMGGEIAPKYSRERDSTSSQTCDCGSGELFSFATVADSPGLCSCCRHQ